MGSPRPSYKELRSRKVAIGSNGLEVKSRKVKSRKVESRKVEGRSQMSQSRSLLRLKYSKRWGRIVYCYESPLGVLVLLPRGLLASM